MGKPGRVLMVLVAVALLGGLGYYFYERNRSALGSGFAGLAGALPGNAQVAVLVDMRTRVKLTDLDASWQELGRKIPAVGKAREQLEQGLGVKISDLAASLAPVAGLAVLPREGETTILPVRADKPGLPVLVLGLLDPEIGQPKVAVFLEHGVAFKTTDFQGVTLHLNADGTGYAFYREAALVGSQPALEACLSVLTGRSPGLAAQPPFQQALSRLPQGEGAMLFLTPGPMLAPLEKVASGQVDAQTVAAFQSMPYAVAGLIARPEGYNVAGFLALDPQSKSDWTRALLTRPSTPEQLAQLAPEDWGNFSAFNLNYAWRALFETGMLLPPARGKLSLLPTGMRLTLGTTPEGLLGTTTGEASLCFAPGKNGFVLALGLKDAKAFRSSLESGFQRLGGLQSIGKEGSVELLGLPGRPRLRVALVEKPLPALLVGLGPGSDEAIRHVIGVAQGGPSLASQPLLATALKAGGDHWVSLGYIDVGRVAGPTFSHLQERMRMAPQEVRSLFEDVTRDAGKKLAASQSASLVTVEPDGLKLETFGDTKGYLEFVGEMVGGIAVPRLVRNRARARLRGCEDNLQTMGMACRNYANDHKGRFPATLKELSPQYLKVPPPCPSAQSDTYSAAYQVSAKADRFTLSCAGEHHADAAIPADCPKFVSEQGLLPDGKAPVRSRINVPVGPPPGATVRRRDPTALNATSGEAPSVSGAVPGKRSLPERAVRPAQARPEAPATPPHSR